MKKDKCHISQDLSERYLPFNDLSVIYNDSAADFSAAINSNLSPAVYTSSGRVYENQTDFPTTEESVASSPTPARHMICQNC
jgi:hypothetical protein